MTTSKNSPKNTKIAAKTPTDSIRRRAAKAAAPTERNGQQAHNIPKKRYDPQAIEKKWQAIWKKSKAFAAKTPENAKLPKSANSQESAKPQESAARSAKNAKAAENPESAKKPESAKPQESAARFTKNTKTAKNAKTEQKLYIAEMFPYPSGAGLHVGHVRNFTIVDVLARFYAQQGLNVLRPFGYDTFGLPAENYAIKTGISPQSATKTNIDNFRNQAQRLGLAIDWDREINTSNPNYYRWTQWCFLQLYKHGLAYRKESYQWWCPKDQTVLANEQVEGGKCWRCGEEVEKKKMKQWYFKITAYADELLDGLSELNWPEKIKTMQKNWIGRSEGAEIDFEVVSSEAKIRVFTTRPDTLFGATFLVLAPEHPLIPKLITPDTKARVEQYCADAIKKSEIERQESKVKTGVFSGSYAKNPATGEKIPIWIGDYVLASYGEGAVMAVPAHDERDHVFARKYNLPIVKVIERPKSAENAQNVKDVQNAENAKNTENDRTTEDAHAPQNDEAAQSAQSSQNDKTANADLCYAGEGKMLNSGQFTGQDSSDAREQIEAWLEERGIGKAKTTYRMRDWLISRQRYWGCPIPIAYDKNGEPHPIPEKMLPVEIPEVKDYQPDHSGRSALAKATDWLNLKIKAADLLAEELTIDGADEKFLKTYLKSLTDENDEISLTRETDTLDGYACSSWYLWRYVSPRDEKYAWDPDAIRYWAPTDIYVGGDHATAHLLYVRFWCKFFADLDLLPFREPIKTLLYNGYINAPDGKKMSKSKGNVIDPLDVIDSGYGADTLRTYEMFIGPYDQDAAWDTKAIGGVYRFLGRAWNLVASEESPSQASSVARNKTIKRVTEDLHRRSFNTAVAALMEYVNELYKIGATVESGTSDKDSAATRDKIGAASGGNTESGAESSATTRGDTESALRVAREDKIALAKLLKPFAPHLASEMLEILGADDSWPEWDESALKSETAEVVVQINGKLRARLTVSTDNLVDDAKLEALALEEPNVKKHLNGKAPKKIVIPKNHKIINLVVVD